MNMSIPAARWRQSQGVLKQTWNPTTGRFETYRVTEEHPVYRKHSHRHLYMGLAVWALLIPAFVVFLSLR